MLKIMIRCHRSVKGGCIIIQKYFPYSQFQRKLEVHLVCYMRCLQQPLFYKGTWKRHCF